MENHLGNGQGTKLEPCLFVPHIWWYSLLGKFQQPQANMRQRGQLAHNLQQWLTGLPRDPNIFMKGRSEAAIKKQQLRR